MMHRLVVILLALSLVALPLRLLVSDACECSTDSSEVVSIDDLALDSSSCCSSESQPSGDDGTPEEDPDNPCDNCECIMQCCGISLTLVALPVSVKGAPPRMATQHFRDTAQVECGSTHISRLKRPPRSLTLTV